MDKIMSFIDNLSIEKYIPKLDSVLDGIHWLIEWGVKIGPLCILVLGLIYMLIPPKEANRFFGFRTYFGMGSIPAWLFTQRVAGFLMTVVGLILFLGAKGAVKSFSNMELMAMSEKALDLIKTQIIAALIIYVFMFLLTLVMFNHKGECRFPGIKKTIIGKLIPDEPVPKKKKNYSKKSTSKKTSSKKKAAPVTEVTKEITAEEALAEEVISEKDDLSLEYERQGEQVITADDIVIEGLD